MYKFPQFVQWTKMSKKLKACEVKKIRQKLLNEGVG